MEKIKSYLTGLKPAQWLPYLVAVIVFAAMTLAYVNPVLQGKQLVQTDIIKWQGMSKEIADFRAQTGEEALWTNSMFGGMPAYQISVVYKNNILNFFHKVMTLWLPTTADMVFLYFIGFFLFLVMLRLNPWIALAGAVAFAFSSYHFIVLEAGHNAKAIAIGYMAPVLGAIVMTFRGQWMAGGLLFALFMGLQLLANHFQITYYLGIIVVLYGLFELVMHIREGKLPVFLRNVGVLLAGLVIAIGLNTGNFWSTYVYTPETMRGGSELTIGEEETTTGLTKEYITAWSYGIHESFSLLIPNVKGGATGNLGSNPHAVQAVSPNFQSIIANENHYWGNQPFTSGPVYVGAVVLFLFILGLFYLKGPLKWGLLAATVLSVLLAWGKNFMPLTDFFIDYFPGYNKFRAVSMTLVIAELCIPALAFAGLHKLYNNPGLFSFKSTAFLTAAGLTAGLALLFYITPGSFFSFFSQMEKAAFSGLKDDPMLATQVAAYTAELEKARMAIFRADAIRSFLFAALAAGMVWLFAAGKLKKPAFILLVVLIITIDMWPINRRHLNDENFVARRRAEVPYPLRNADTFILNDKGLNHRVLDMTENPFTSARTSYYHHSLGGYHGAKLQRYQDVIDHHLTPNLIAISNSMRESGDPEEIAMLVSSMPVLNMLNTRYLIYHPDNPPFVNESALGNAWFIHDFLIVSNADEEIRALQDIDAGTTAIIDQRFAAYVSGKSFAPDPEAWVELVDAQPNRLTYNYSAASEQVLVFSEVFYPEGWKVSIDNEPATHFRANYILRAMVVPAGTHEIVFRFEPRSYHAGEKVSLAFSVLLVVLLLSATGLHIYRKGQGTEKPVA